MSLYDALLGFTEKIVHDGVVGMKLDVVACLGDFHWCCYLY